MENSVMFLVGTIIFSLYIVGYMMMVRRQNQIQKLESEKNNFNFSKTDELDIDGHGNWGRFSEPKVRNKILQINKKL